MKVQTMILLHEIHAVLSEDSKTTEFILAPAAGMGTPKPVGGMLRSHSGPRSGVLRGMGYMERI